MGFSSHLSRTDGYLSTLSCLRTYMVEPFSKNHHKAEHHTNHRSLEGLRNPHSPAFLRFLRTNTECGLLALHYRDDRPNQLRIDLISNSPCESRTRFLAVKVPRPHPKVQRAENPALLVSEHLCAYLHHLINQGGTCLLHCGKLFNFVHYARNCSLNNTLEG